MVRIPSHYPSLSPQERKLVREEYVKLQRRNCYHCGSSLDGNPPKEIRSLKINRFLFPQNFFKYPVHLHHNHDTGDTIGAVHNYCNAVLWEYHGE